MTQPPQPFAFDPPPPEHPVTRPPSALRRHRTVLAVGTAVVALAVAGGIALAVLPTAGSSTPPAAAPSTSAAAPGRGGAGHTVRGLVLTESAATWTVRVKAGGTVTVLITPQTMFGTKKAPASAASFPIGAPVVVTGTLTGTTITATRVAAPATTSPTTSPSPTPAAS